MKSNLALAAVVMALVATALCATCVMDNDVDAVTVNVEDLNGKTINMSVGSSLTITFMGNEMTTSYGVYQATGMPSWLTISNSGQASISTISGTATTTGTWTITATYYYYHGGTSSSNIEGSYSATFTVSVTSSTTTTTYTYYLYYDANGGSGAPSTQSGTTSSSTGVTLTVRSTVPVYSGHTFEGWSTSSTATTATYSGGDSITIYRNTTLYAVWTVDPVIYTVSFNANGGTGTISSQDVESTGSGITLPSSGVTKSGYYLSGWGTSSSGGTVYEPGTTYLPTSDITLYAQWTELPESNDSDAPSTAVVGTEYTYTVNTRSSSNSATSWVIWAEKLWSGSFSVVTDGLPDWLSVDTSTTYYVTISGTPTSSDVGVNTVSLYIRGSSATAWKDASLVEWVITVSETEPSTYTVSFSSNGGSGSQASITDIQSNNAITLPGSDEIGFTRSGYTLFGWQDQNASGSPIYLLGSILTITKDTVLSAYWVADTNIVVLDANGGSGTIVTTGLTGSTVTLPSSGVTRGGYTLAGWYSGTVSSGVYAPGYILDVSGAVYMKAYWIADGASTLRVTYNSNGGAGSLSQTVTSGTKVVLPVHGFTKSGATFTGWSTSSSGTALTSPYPVTAATTLYAQWDEETVTSYCTVTFSANGGVGSYTPQTVVSGDTIDKPSDPTRSGYVFTGWRVVGGASDWDFDTAVTSSMTLEAQWAQHYTIAAEGLEITLTFATAYSGLNSSIDWGDGSEPQTTNSRTVSHEYSESCTGTIVVTTTVSSGTVSSSMPFGVTAEADAEPVAVGSLLSAGSGRWTLDASGSSNFTEIQWYLDGELVSGDVTYTTGVLAVGTHEVILKAISASGSDQWVGSITVAEGSDDTGLDTRTIVLIVVIAILALFVMRLI